MSRVAHVDPGIAMNLRVSRTTSLFVARGMLALRLAAVGHVEQTTHREGHITISSTDVAIMGAPMSFYDDSTDSGI